ncbi:MAG TPA: hypothetical protein PK776_08085 [Flavobacterium sp.]|nr:hypothetical protein [Flavobacterium sp.]
MKKNLLYISMLFLGICGHAQKLSDFNRVNVEGFFTNPVVSPDGTHALLTGEHFKGIYLLDLAKNTVQKISDKDGSGYGYTWDRNNSTFYFKEKGDKEFFSQSRVYAYDVATQRRELKDDINHTFLPSYQGKETPVVVYTNLMTLKIEAKDLATEKTWVITNDEGQFYNAILSNDGKKVAVHNGADIFVYDLNGKNKPVKVGTGIATGWSADDQFLLGFLDESEDGHSVSNSELYLFDTKAFKPRKITNTEVFAEMFPSFYGKNKVLFTDDKTGRIFTSELKN